MSRVLLVAPEFPPANTAGAHRPRLLARHLPEFGWTPTVLTIKREAIEGPLDPMLEELVDPMLNVIRTSALPVRPIRVIGDIGIRSLWHHARAISAVAGRGEADAIVLFGPPWFSFALGPLMRRRFGTPYVVDYIDPWMSDWTASHPFPTKGWFYHRAAKAIEPVVLRSAAHITAVSPGFLDELRTRYPWLDGDRMSAMPYGADPDDMQAAARLGIEPPDFSAGDAFNVCFTGAIQPRGQALLRATLTGVRALRDSGSAAGRRVRLRFYGTSNLTWGHDRHAVLDLARAMGLGDVVAETPERIPYLQALAVLAAADVVVVMGSSAAQYDASKLYPALVSGRPILALCHRESRMRRVMEDTHAGCCVTFDTDGDLENRGDEIGRALETLAARPPRRPDATAIEPFGARASGRQLAAILDGLAGRRARRAS